MPFEVVATTEETKILRAAPKGRAGRPAKVQNPVWTLTSGPGTLVTDSADPLKALYTTPDTLDPVDMLNDIAHISFNADADLGEGVEPLEDSGSITVVDPKAASLGVTVESGPDKV